MTSFCFPQKPLLAAACLAVFAVPAAFSQSVVERNAPPAPPRSSGALTLGGESLEGSTNDKPFGSAILVGVRLLGPKEDETKSAGPAVGVLIGDLGDDAPRGELVAALRPYFGRPLSPKLISDLEAAVAKVYRAEGRPFVSVSLPKQDATGGAILLRVVEFNLGATVVTDASGSLATGSQEALLGDLRTTRGGRIDAASLEEDLDWLNRNPFRRVQGVFAPGDAFATSDMTLSVTEEKPWQVYAGWSNSGAKSTGENRFFAGGAATLSALNDTLLTYQFTCGDDIGEARPGYLSHSGRITVPTASRQALEISGNLVSTKQVQSLIPGADLRTENDTWEIPVAYRAALSDIFPGLHAGDALLGFEVKHAERAVFFADAPLGKGGADIFQLVAGWDWSPRDAYGATDITLRGKWNPGGDDEEWRTFSGGRVTDSQYAYATLDLTRRTPLGEDVTWVAAFSGVWSCNDLPDTELMAPGGFQGARGYLLDDGTADNGLTLRNELRLPGASFDGEDSLSPFVFLDYGYGRSKVSPVNLVSAGAGADWSLNSHISAGGALAFALRDAAVTKSGDARLVVRVTVSY